MSEHAAEGNAGAEESESDLPQRITRLLPGEPEPSLTTHVVSVVLVVAWTAVFWTLATGETLSVRLVLAAGYGVAVVLTNYLVEVVNGYV